MMLVKDQHRPYVADIETLGTDQKCVVVSAAFLAFDFKANKTFEELLADTFYVKFNISEQKKMGRTIDKSTLEWWQGQAAEVKRELLPSPADRSVKEGVAEIKAYLETHGIHLRSNKNVFRFCRGQDFDFPILGSLFKEVEEELPGAFWNSRDIRTFISSVLMDLSQSTIYKDGVEYKTLKGFKKHDARHDVAKAVLEMQNACRLVTGELAIENL